MLIAICGIDGAGKSTQIEMLKEDLEKNGNNVYLTKQPTDFYRKYDRLSTYKNRCMLDTDFLIREELSLLSAADKLRHYQLIKTYIENGIVLSDRYVYSAYAYFFARGLNIDWLKAINSYLPLPDITICIDLDVHTAMERVCDRDKDGMMTEEKDIVLLEQVRQIFINQPWGENANYYIVNGKQSIYQLHSDIMSLVSSKL